MNLPEITTDAPAINFPELMERVENDRDLLNDLLEMFRDEFPRQRKLLDEAVKSEDMKQIHATGHTLKGILANLSMARAVRAAAQIELAGKENNSAEIKTAITALDAEAANIFAELNADRTDATV